MPRFVLAADLGGTKIAAARVEETGRIAHFLSAPTPALGGAAVMDAITGLLRQLPRERVCALAVDVPGQVHPDGSVWAPNIPGWKHTSVRSILRRRFRLPALVESDRNACVTGEAWLGAARGCKDVVFVAVGTGIGAGIISGGRLIRGQGELAGCLGWMAVASQILPEYKGVGCLESHAAGPGISRAAGRKYGREISMEELVRQARRGDSQAVGLIAEAGRHLGLALANLVSILAPEMIVIGGGVAAAGALLLGPARETMQLWAQPLAVQRVRVVRSQLGSEAALLGAAKLAFDLF